MRTDGILISPPEPMPRQVLRCMPAPATTSGRHHPRPGRGQPRARSQAVPAALRPVDEPPGEASSLRHRKSGSPPICQREIWMSLTVIVRLLPRPTARPTVAKWIGDVPIDKMPVAVSWPPVSGPEAHQGPGVSVAAVESALGRLQQYLEWHEEIRRPRFGVRRYQQATQD